MFRFAFSAVLLVLHSSFGWAELPSNLNTSNSAVQQEIVDAHNYFRSNVQPPAKNMLEVSWNSEAAVNAQKWANSCTYRHSLPEARKTSEMNCGENIFEATHPVKWTEAIEGWDSESENFVYDLGAIDNKPIGHYSQLAWYRSNEVGCGVAYCPTEKMNYFYVCHYCPAGNTKGHLGTPYATGQTCADCPNTCRNNLCTKACTYRDFVANCGPLKEYCTGIYSRYVLPWCPGTCLCKGEEIK